MNTFDADGRRTLVRAVATALLAFGFLAEASLAQSVPAAPVTPVPDAMASYAPLSGASLYWEPQRSARGLFMATVLGLVGQGIGQSVAQGIGGIITRWFGNPDTGSPAPATTPVAGVAALAGESPTASVAAPPQAGIAYEVHARRRDGSTLPVDPATHEFRTGDQFVVFYRPSLPGRVDVINVNPRGVESGIDGKEVAAGQLVQLGPYEFADARGDEELRIVLSPCTSDRLLQATRQIVKVGTTDAPAPSGAAALAMATCGPASATRSARAVARNIQKVIREGSTTFALDAIGPDEMASATLAAREVRITMMHR